MKPLCQMQHLLTDEDLESIENKMVSFKSRRIIVYSSYYKSIFSYEILIKNCPVDVWVSMDDALEKESNFIRFELNSNFYFGFDHLVTHSFKEEAVKIIDAFTDDFLKMLDNKIKASPLRLYAVTNSLFHPIERRYAAHFDFINHNQIQKRLLSEPDRIHVESSTSEG